MKDCDDLFLPDFMKLDSTVSKIEKRKKEDLEFLFQNMSSN